PLRKAPLRKAPLRKAPLPKAPLRKAPLRKVPLRKAASLHRDHRLDRLFLDDALAVVTHAELHHAGDGVAARALALHGNLEGEGLLVVEVALFLGELGLGQLDAGRRV